MGEPQTASKFNLLKTFSVQFFLYMLKPCPQNSFRPVIIIITWPWHGCVDVSGLVGCFSFTAAQFRDLRGERCNNKTEICSFSQYPRVHDNFKFNTILYYLSHQYRNKSKISVDQPYAAHWTETENKRSLSRFGKSKFFQFFGFSLYQVRMICRKLDQSGQFSSIF
jgi:hypothetical protein